MARYSSRDNRQVQKITLCSAKLMGWDPPISRPNGSKMTRGKCIRFFGLKITLVEKKKKGENIPNILSDIFLDIRCYSNIF